MKDQIQMLLELGFPLRFDWKISELNGYADNPSDVPDPIKEYKEPNLQGIKEWLWNKYKIAIFVFRNTELNGSSYNCEASIHEIDSRLFVPEYFSSPIAAEIDGIEKTIEYLYDEHHKTKVL